MTVLVERWNVVMTVAFRTGYTAETGQEGKFLRIGFIGVWYGFGYGTGLLSSLCVLRMQ
jgi:hypothetical protein